MGAFALKPGIAWNHLGALPAKTAVCPYALNMEKRTIAMLAASALSGVLIGVLATLGVVTGGSTAAPTQSPSSSESPTGAASPESSKGSGSQDNPDMTLVSDPNFPEVRYQYELDFFKMALASCDAVKSKGAVFSNNDGSVSLIGLSSQGTLVQVNLDQAGAVVASFAPEGELICGPASVHEAATSKWADQTNADDFHLDWMMADNYCWHQHQGSASMSNTYFTFENGLVSEVSDMDRPEFTFSKVTFGFDKTQAGLVSKVKL